MTLKDDLHTDKKNMADLNAALKKLKEADLEMAEARKRIGDVAYREYMTETSLQTNSNYNSALLGEFGKKLKALGESVSPDDGTGGKKSKKTVSKGVTTGGDYLAFAAENVEKGYGPEVSFTINLA